MKNIFLLFIIFIAAQVSGQDLGAQLQSNIAFISLKPNSGKIAPGSQVKLSAAIRNVGDLPNNPGTIYIRFCFQPQIKSNQPSIIFESEKIEIPSIQAGEEYSVEFTKPHLWPTLFDFVKHDWGMREYEAVIQVDGKELVTGTRAIAFSAYYYEGTSREIPSSFPSEMQKEGATAPSLPVKFQPPTR